MHNFSSQFISGHVLIYYSTVWFKWSYRFTYCYNLITTIFLSWLKFFQFFVLLFVKLLFEVFVFPLNLIYLLNCETCIIFFYFIRCINLNLINYFLNSSSNNFTNFFSASNNTLFHWKRKFSDTGSNAGCLLIFNLIGIILSNKLLS